MIKGFIMDDGRLKNGKYFGKDYFREFLERVRSIRTSERRYIIENRNTFTMQQFAESVNKFLTFNEYKVLTGKAAISAIQAKEKAYNEYEKFNKTQKITSDFDKAIKALNKPKN